MSLSNVVTNSLGQLHERVFEALVKHGWRGCDGAAVAIKEYPTAVGPREAHAYLIDCLASERCVVLTGQYWSEGRNIIETLFMRIDADLNVPDTQAVVDRYVLSVDQAVANSYAGRLYEQGVRAV